MNLVLLLILVALVVLGVLWVWRAPKRSQSRNLLPGVRREAAQTRQIPKANEHLFTREVTTGKRRFFFDVDQSERGKVLKISEVQSERGRQDQAFTLIVFAREIAGFQRALGDAARSMDVKFSELRDYYTKFSIVADEARKPEYEKKIGKDTFRFIRESVGFLSFERLSEIHTTSKRATEAAERYAL